LDFRLLIELSLSLDTVNTVFKCQSLSLFILLLSFFRQLFLFIFAASLLLFVRALIQLVLLSLVLQKVDFWINVGLHKAVLIRSEIEIFHEVDGSLFELILLQEVVDKRIMVQKMNRGLLDPLLELI